jgi:pimeloyl-ACP methyl ester carboxylesterase
MIYYGLLLLFLLLLALWAVGYLISNLLLYPLRQPVTRTPGDYGLAYEDISFYSPDNLCLKGWWIPPGRASHPEKQARAVIILHPMFGNRHGFRPQPQAWSRLLQTDVDLIKTARGLYQAGYAVLLFDFRNHGESQSGLCAGGLTEDQDVVGAVDYVFSRLAAQAPTQAPQVGLIGFGLGAAAAIAAVGRVKGGDETIRVFTGDSEGGVGYTEIKPANVKKLCFLVAVQPASLGGLLYSYLRQLFAPLALVLVPVVDRLCQWRGGYPLESALLLKLVRDVNNPVLYIQARQGVRAGWADDFASGEVQRFFDATPGPKQLWWIESPPGRLEAYTYIGEHLERVLAFMAQQVSCPHVDP